MFCQQPEAPAKELLTPHPSERQTGVRSEIIMINSATNFLVAVTALLLCDICIGVPLIPY